ncbi:Nucleolar protein 12 [Cryptotrichosporon argae]
MAKDKSKQDKKRKVESGAAPAAASTSTGLFGGVKDAALDDLFSKGDAFAKTAAPAPTPAAPVVPTASTSSAAAERPAKKARKDKKARSAVGSDDDAGELDAAPGPAAAAPRAVAPIQQVEDGEDGQSSDGSDSEGDAGELVHESVKAARARRERRGRAQKYVPAGETAVERDRRTVFVGNLPVEVAKSKSITHALRAHVLAFAPGAKIESVRFRSVAFATPTAALPSDDPERDASRRTRKEKERAAAWRAQQATGANGVAVGRKTGEEGAETPKVFLDAKGKRKVAFIKGDFHAELASCNAYIVFAHAPPSRPSTLPPILDPFAAAARALAADGSVFHGLTLKVDALRAPSAVALKDATTALGRRDAWLPAGADPKKSLFVGGLDYAAKDEDVRAFFEALVVAERGVPAAGAGAGAGVGADAGAEGQGADEAGAGAQPKWVTSVRIVRDKDTQLGKGFGYVHFADRESVDEIIAMDSKRLKFAKRPLRVQPCKTLPPKPAPAPASVSAASGAGTGPGGKDTRARKPRMTKAAMPKGNPALGERLRALSKEDRKVAKAADAERQARRRAKKQLKHAHERDAAASERARVSLAPTKAERQRTDRKVKAKKGRVRSANALKKMKGSM